jgi:hypothetical protein
MPTFVEFLAAFDRGLTALQQRIEGTGAQRPAVRYEPNAGDGGADEVQIGVGQIVRAGAIGKAGICLNNKGAAALRLDAAPLSVTDLVLDAPDALFAHWRRVAAHDHTSERFFNRFTLVVEDASPDSCYGLFCLLARLADVPRELFPPIWTEHIRRWELGETPVGRPEAVYGPLHSALVHRTVDSDIARSWLDGLRLLRSDSRAIP